MPALKVFAFDYASGGGPLPRALPPSLLHQGRMTLHALLADLGALPGVELITLDQPDPAAAGEPFEQRLGACMQAADAVWPLAPEAGGLLERISREVLGRGRVLLGSAPDAVHVGASKLLTVRALAGAGIAAVATYAPGALLPPGEGAWVVKPEHGAGCLDTRLFSDSGAALAWIGAGHDGACVLQPYVGGKLGSLSLLCCNGMARLLSCNEQRIAVRDNQFHFLGSTVNSLGDPDGAFERLAHQVAAAMPGLWGYVGVDFVFAEGGVVVLEVNPRVTTSYVGLHASIGCNPAALVLGLLDGAAGLPPAPRHRRAVSVDVEAFSML